jgi:hypothetical protein
MADTTALPACQYCGGWHTTTCPRIKSIEYHTDGAVKRVEFHSVAAVAPDREGERKVGKWETIKASRGERPLDREGEGKPRLYCSVCGEYREDEYTCRKGGKSIPLDREGEG